jgi:GNAT superfamily N-acetyltransferase
VTAAVTIRSAVDADLERLLELYVQLSPANAETTFDSARPALAEVIEAPHIYLLVAEAEGHVVGTVTLVLVPNLTHNGAPWAQVENMVVDESLRGSGIGRALIDECLRIAKEHGCYKVQLQSGNQRREGPNDAHAFYRRLGFEPSSVGFRLYFD